MSLNKSVHGPDDNLKFHDIYESRLQQLND